MDPVEHKVVGGRGSKRDKITDRSKRCVHVSVLVLLLAVNEGFERLEWN
jgi:hypothetical protein